MKITSLYITKSSNEPGSEIKQVFHADKYAQESYEVFVNNLNEGAAIGKKMYHPRSFKITTKRGV